MTRTAVELVEEALGWRYTAVGDPPREEAAAFDAEVAALRASNAELTCKGEDLCQHHGNAILEMERLRARVAELEAPRSPNALELAERMTHAWLRIHHAERENADLASIEYDAARAALVAYDKRK